MIPYSQGSDLQESIHVERKCFKKDNNTCHIRGSEKAMASPSSSLAWKIPWTEEPGRLQSVGSLRVGHDWATSLSLFTLHWRRKWQPTPVFLPGESQGRGAWWAVSMGWHRVGHDWSDLAAAAAFEVDRNNVTRPRWTAARTKGYHTSAGVWLALKYFKQLSLFSINKACIWTLVRGSLWQ